jgi:hypothetical protein
VLKLSLAISSKPHNSKLVVDEACIKIPNNKLSSSIMSRLYKKLGFLNIQLL